MSTPEFQSQEYLLPVVSEETAEATIQDIYDVGQLQYFDQAREALKAHNPSALESVLGYVKGSSDNNDTQALAMRAVVLFHELLSKQARGDALESRLEDS